MDSLPDPRGPLRAAADEGPHPFAATLRRVLEARPRVEKVAAGVKPAAVLVAFFEGPSGEPRLWLLRRPTTLRTHSGQVALPGGRRDPGDPDLVSTALREAEEEIGLDRHRVEVLGVFDDVVTGTGYVITPVVGWVAGPFEPVPSPAEVSRAFSVPFAIFRDSALVELIPFEPLKQLVRAFRVDGEIVWGATAKILTALAEHVPPA